MIGQSERTDGRAETRNFRSASALLTSLLTSYPSFRSDEKQQCLWIRVHSV